jgi:hypothetical protein
MGKGLRGGVEALHCCGECALIRFYGIGHRGRMGRMEKRSPQAITEARVATVFSILFFIIKNLG